MLNLKFQDKVYLVDFGLASHYTTKDEYKLDPKKAHNGTIEYTSRDAHIGGKDEEHSMKFVNPHLLFLNIMIV